MASSRYQRPPMLAWCDAATLPSAPAPVVPSPRSSSSSSTRVRRQLARHPAVGARAGVPALAPRGVSPWPLRAAESGDSARSDDDGQETDVVMTDDDVENAILFFDEPLDAASDDDDSDDDTLNRAFILSQSGSIGGGSPWTGDETTGDESVALLRCSGPLFSGARTRPVSPPRHPQTLRDNAHNW